MSESIDIFRFWAKTSHDEERPSAFHPLICHLIDVAVVTKAIWDNVLPTATKKRIAISFGENDFSDECLDEIGWLVAFIAGLHDLGKCSPPFTLRGKNEKRKQTERLLKLYENTPFSQTTNQNSPSKDAPHGYITAVELPNILETDFNFPRNLARSLSTMIGGHHGIFPTTGKLQSLRGNEASVGKLEWKIAREQLTSTLADLLQISREFQNLSDKPLDNATTMILAGLISVADWIGSDTQFFDCWVEDFNKPLEFDLVEYLTHAKRQAEKALRQLGWLEWVEIKEPKNFAELFPVIKTPRHLQNMSVEISEELKSPGIVVVEAPMGEGKTEAAMFLADTWNANLKQRGIYFALPTQATSNQMFGRVEKFLTNRFEKGKIHLQLQHGHASLSGEFETLKDNFRNLKGISDDECTDGACVPNVVAAEWFTYRKRGLLAPFGVGTVDQALMAVLQTKHVFVRLFGLAHKTIIIDEVHAYDAYMSTLLERLLEWLAALSSPVVLLSATLPRNRRNALIKAYQKGLGKITEEDKPVIEGEDIYPRISYAIDEKIQVKTVSVSEKNQTLHIEKVDENFVEELKARLEKEGGCVAIICNTVRGSQDMFLRLSQDEFFQGLASDGKPKLDLLHARFRYLDRKVREERCLERFRKPDENDESTHRPDCAVLISTQIIEQSLDLDFDLMISELAPIDLLLQRAGRLHRHNRKRPDSLSTPMLWIVQPETDENGFLLADKKGLPDFGKSGIVYDKHILLRTWLKLKEINEIKIPDEIEELIETVYNDEIQPVSFADGVTTFWNKTLERHLAALENEEEQAKDRYIKRPSYSGHLSNIFANNLEEDTPEIHKSLQAVTRLAEPSVTTVCLWENDGKIFLDEQLTKQIDLNWKPHLEMTKELLKRSVGVTNKGVVFQFFAEVPPESWKDSALLRSHKVILFDRERNAEKFGYVFRLDENVGLQITKKENRNV